MTSVLVTGATGYIGGRLVPLLENSGISVRCLARQPAGMQSRVLPTTEVVSGDLFDPASLDRALDGIDVAYYLVLSMGAHGDYAEKDRVAARNFGQAARQAGVRRIVYLGGLANDADELSTHLRSRLETGDVLRSSGVPVLEFRASVVIGSGSLSYELIRALVERLPVMICPRWVSTLAQPIGVDDLLAYLKAALSLPYGPGQTFEIGGADQASYGDLMREYARQRGLKRALISVPLLTPRLSSLWLGLVTPLYARVGRELIDGLKSRSVVEHPEALSVFPVRPVGLTEAIARAIRYEDRAFAPIASIGGG
ncbi:MAG: NAD(P)H-binding protein, partial [Vicinamibacterales bacterium]